MIVGFQSVADNPIRMGFFSEWITVTNLILKSVQKYYKAATDPFLQATASHVIGRAPQYL